MMMSQRVFLSFFLVVALAALPLVSVSVSAQDPPQSEATAVMRGYRAGYSDGYPAGIQDAAKNGDRNFRDNAEYQQADRAYVATHGSLEEYRNGYRQGFEAGYGDGYDRKSFDSTIPQDLKVREQADSQAPTLTNATKTSDANTADPSSPSANSPSPTANSPSPNGGPLMIPRDTIMRVELLSNLSTDASQKGDRFQARVLEPQEYEGAMVQGEIARVERPGRVKGTAELQLVFDEIRFADGRSAKMSAQVIEVIQTGTSQGVGKVDEEGGVKGKDSTKHDVKRVGMASGVGAVIGAIFGGGSGAAIGATIGAGVGTAGVLRERGKDIYLYQGQQLRIRTAANTEVQ